MRFYLGTHETSWLADAASPPLFISRRRLARLKRLPVAVTPWALDSGGFSELSLFGHWETSPEQYSSEVVRYAAEIGGLEWAAIQDWMCEPFMVQKTGLSVREHQRLSVESYGRLLDLAPDVPWAPVLQGMQVGDYLNHSEMYAGEGLDLSAAPVVAVGSVCRRQGTREAEGIMRAIARLGLRLHGLGFKITGLPHVADVLESADSLAWSYRARRSPPMAGCAHRSCANCPRFAREWYQRVLSLIETRPQRQGVLL